MFRLRETQLFQNLSLQVLASPTRNATLKKQVAPRLRKTFPTVSLWFPYGSPVAFLWFSYGFPMAFLLFPYSFLIVFLLFFDGFPMVSPWFSNGYPIMFL